MIIRFGTYVILALSLTIFGATASPNFKLNIEVVDIQLHEFTLQVQKDCRFSAYRKGKKYTTFFAKCENGSANLKVENAKFDVRDFEIKQVSGQAVPMKLTGGRIGIDFEKLANEFNIQ